MKGKVLRKGRANEKGRREGKWFRNREKKKCRSCKKPLTIMRTNLMRRKKKKTRGRRRKKR